MPNMKIHKKDLKKIACVVGQRLLYPIMREKIPYHVNCFFKCHLVFMFFTLKIVTKNCFIIENILLKLQIPLQNHSVWQL